jgi:YD repeat-containing protein
MARLWHKRAIVAVLAGLITGLCFAELAIADIIPPKATAVTPGGINIADGSFSYSVTDLSMGSLKLERFYRYGWPQSNDPVFGRNFSSNFEIYIADSRTTAAQAVAPVVHIGNSASGTYIGSGASVFPNNLDAEKGLLGWNGSQYVYTDSSGTIYTFSATIQAKTSTWASFSRRIERIDYPDGRRQSFSYDASGNLKLVEDSAGFAMVFDYNANGDVLTGCAFNRSQTYVSATSTCAGAALKTSYTYGGTGGTYPGQWLATETDVMNQVTTYTQGIPSIGLTCIQPPGFASCAVSLNLGTGGGTQSLLDSGTWTVTHDDPAVVNNPDASPADDGSNAVTVTDPNGIAVTHYFTKSSPYTIMNANGSGTSFRYEGGSPYNNPWTFTTYGSFLRSATFPEGNQYLAEYIGPFKSITKETLVPKPGSGQSNLIKAYGYGPCTSPGSYQNCAKPIWIKDPNNNQADYTYATHGGMLSQMQPAPVPGVARPLKLYTYAQKFAYIKNSVGTLIQAATPIWMPVTETTCQTATGSSTAVCDGTAMQTVVTYEYGADGTANNLWARGKVVSSGGTSRRSCFGYDNQGNKIWDTSPRAGLGSCP